MKYIYIDAEKLKAEIERRKELLEKGSGHPEVMKRVAGVISAYDSILSFIDSLQQEREIVELSFKGGTYRANGEEHSFKGGKAKVVILEINQGEGDE